MTINVGSVDRIFRLLLGVILLALPFVGNFSFLESSTAKAASIVAGLVLLGTSAMRSCPLYRIFGIRT